MFMISTIKPRHGNIIQLSNIGSRILDLRSIAPLQEIVESQRPNLTPYADFYRNVHQHPEVSGMEEETARKVSTRVSAATALSVYSGIQHQKASLRVQFHAHVTPQY
ncbi:uncharacterized protein B0H64DRAFT_375370 [Chaetomium fimeti]|uniref:Uncharacterized protein n=1 Tax=Chaetomium fimeti TaxID=1854472 RepID=A0AAE0HDS1_9PEZI|nr:hypothetical protein B0H64DRAFT_375370 [Chaetomium fimeti]